jgi:hypothetical protein
MRELQDVTERWYRNIPRWKYKLETIAQSHVIKPADVGHCFLLGLAIGVADVNRKQMAHLVRRCFVAMASGSSPVVVEEYFRQMVRSVYRQVWVLS